MTKPEALLKVNKTDMVVTMKGFDKDLINSASWPTFTLYMNNSNIAKVIIKPDYASE